MHPMNLPDLETEALNLPLADRARLAETLLKSFDGLTNEENRRLWIEEARRRDASQGSSSRWANRSSPQRGLVRFER